MKLLLDANLSWRLAKLLSPPFDDVVHVDRTELVQPATDSDIWGWAKSNNAVIVTNDEDFFYFSVQKGFPPKIVLLRTGNQSTKNVAELLLRHQVQIRELYASQDYGLLEIV
ncbi:MAG: DUF5615 family PIN-like protein [Saprospiraceae bacterium]|nr:DUF5615 family PIN-like protein [Lewinella sp.]